MSRNTPPGPHPETVARKALEQIADAVGQVTLAELLGVSQSVVSDILLRRRRPRDVQRFAILAVAEGFGISLQLEDWDTPAEKKRLRAEFARRKLAAADVARRVGFVPRRAA